MPKSCSAYNCTNRYSSKNPDLTFHRFPFSKPSVLKQWLDNIGREDFQPKRHMVICSHHFTSDCFSGLGNRKNLLWNAVPTVFTFPPSNTKVLGPFDHSYALTDPIETKARLFSTLDINRQLHKRLKIKCQVIRRMRLKLCAARQELASLRAGRSIMVTCGTAL
ncbi:THAP domain-containing protein 3 [Megalops cyprinoides]|uniref:THAP domain-containing protein 3 n=1 Tax=Megalops cyprinoides TaxID=118141 RepID=UPI0018645D8B|nr:THAP domain-containing protein 3 [Megalops cyprinoides]